MYFYNLEEVLYDDRAFLPAELEPRDVYGMPIVPDHSPVLRISQLLCDLSEPRVPGYAM